MYRIEKTTGFEKENVYRAQEAIINYLYTHDPIYLAEVAKIKQHVYLSAGDTGVLIFVEALLKEISQTTKDITTQDVLSVLRGSARLAAKLDPSVNNNSNENNKSFKDDIKFMGDTEF